METKQVILVRTDLDMSIGKVAAQCAHGSLSAMRKADKNIITKWEKEGEKKVVLKVSSLDELLEIKKKCDELKIPNALISDAGKTELEPGTITVLGIGPDYSDKIDKVTGNLKML